MRIARISAMNLFGIFDHVIPLNRDERITIIHGPNGFGKTILLRMINGFFRGDYNVFRSVPMREFSVELESGDEVKVTRPGPPRRAPEEPIKLDIALYKGGKQEERFLSKPPSEEKEDFSLSQIDHMVPELERVGPRSWQFGPTGEVYDLERVLSTFGDRIRVAKREPGWLTKLRESVQVRFLETQRLLSIGRTRPYTRDERERGSMLPAVSRYSRELARAVQSVLADYAKLSQELDRTFPVRLVEQPRSAELSKRDLRDRLSQLEEKRLRLVEAGLLDKATSIVAIPQVVEDRTRSVLSVYVADVEKKLDALGGTAAKLDLLKKVINQRFQYKSMTINKDAGFVFTTSNGEVLSPECLSSGEQHELVLLYEMLFHVAPGTLFLIDEPEISLHVAWQVQFLLDTSEIAKLASFDVLIATHSPQIINKRWDLTVKLRGPAP